VRFFVFNGDADGLCALQQLHLAEGLAGAHLVTGPKRHTRLLAHVPAREGDEVTVLDISFNSNREDVRRLLADGARVRYFDHHHAGELPAHAGLEAHIDTSPKVCTSVIVDRYLEGRHRAWAAVGAYGDNLAEIGRSLVDSRQLETLGILLNYNSYGETEADLFFPPAELHRRLASYEDPHDFLEDEAHERLARGYEEDMSQVDGLRPVALAPHAALYVLPDAPWARRVSGTLANRLARGAPDKAHAILSPNRAGGMQVSVRAPLERPSGCAALCLEFPTGGGREAAAGINHLPLDSVDAFAERFIRHFGTGSTR
jgi:hypothetical protein